MPNKSCKSAFGESYINYVPILLLRLAYVIMCNIYEWLL